LLYIGTNISFFKYRDHENNLRITAKTKGSALLTDTQYGKFLSEALKALGIENLSDLDLINNPPTILEEFVNTEAYQSITLELCGQNIPHLVKYPFDIGVKPLFYTTHDGKIKPIIHAQGVTEHGPFEYTDKNVLINLCEKLQKQALETNIQYRLTNGLSNKYEYDHFVAEGFVLYLCDTDRYVMNRIMYKVKPSDIEEVHWSKFDEKRKSQVRDVLQKMKERGLDSNNEDILREELDMAKKEWKRFSREVLAYKNELEQQEKSPQGSPRSVESPRRGRSHRGNSFSVGNGTNNRHSRGGSFSGKSFSGTNKNNNNNNIVNHFAVENLPVFPRRKSSAQPISPRGGNGGGGSGNYNRFNTGRPRGYSESVARDNTSKPAIQQLNAVSLQRKNHKLVDPLIQHQQQQKQHHFVNVTAN
jgi:hypothetical protein